MINRVTPNIKRLQKVAGGVLVVVVLGACSAGGGGTDHGSPRHVFLIGMGNKSAQQARAGVYTRHLAATEGVANNYRAIAQPSVPNCRVLTSGSSWGIQDDSYHKLTKHGL